MSKFWRKCCRQRMWLNMCLSGLVVLLGSPAFAQAPQVAADFTLEPLVENLRGPTQFTFAPDGRLYVAELAGGENSGTGQVVAVDVATGEREVLLRDLFKPTGLAVTEAGSGTNLWVMAGDRLLRAPLTAAGVGETQVVLRDLPNNGRSSGTLTLTPAGELLYETSGALTQNGAQPDSGVLWQFDPAAPVGPQNPKRLATGLKGAYAHAFAEDGTLYTTELGDDLMDGAPPPDELNVVVDGADYGWPKCYGQRLPARNTGGTDDFCATTKAPLALFARGATPTSVAASPFTEGTLLVALWVPSEVVQVDAQTGEVTPVLTGLLQAQHLLADGERVLVSSFGAGTIYQLEKQ